MVIKIDESRQKSVQDAALTDNLILAYLGDAVLELLARDTGAAGCCRSISELHAHTVSMVSANAQSEALAKILPLLSEEELAVFKRGRNVKSHTAPKHTDPAVYHRSTGLEALFGFLFLTGQTERINSLFYTGFLSGADYSEVL